MKFILSAILVLLFSSSFCHGQISFEKGYYINETGIKIDGLVKNRDWRENPSQFQFKKSENGEIQKLTIESVREFGINDNTRFIKKTLEIDVSSQRINTITDDRAPNFQNKTVFLRVLLEGQSSLYSYTNSSLTLFFFSKPNSEIEQLVYKRYLISKNNLGENTTYREQILNSLKCPNFSFTKIQEVDYVKKDLVAIISEYNQCVGADYHLSEKKQKKDLFNITLRPRINNSSTATPNPIFVTRTLDFERKMGFGFGVETEFILPFNKNKWSIILEAAYQTFKGQNEVQSNNISGGQVFSKLDYASIEVPFGFRHYLFLNDKNKIFVNLAYTFDFTTKSSLSFTRADGSILDSAEFRTQGSYSGGIGFKHNDKFSLEFRIITVTNRTLLFSGSTFDSTSLIFGYTLF